MHPSYFRQDDPTPKSADLNSFDALYTTLDKIIGDFRQRKLQVDFLHMELVQNKAGEDAIVYTGKGYTLATQSGH
jgi:hypothetical protein